MENQKINSLYLAIICAFTPSISHTATTIYTDSDFPRGHTYINGNGNTLHVQNSNMVVIESTSVPTGGSGTGVLSIENHASLIVDNTITVNHLGGGDGKGHAILVTDAGKARFKGDLIASTVLNNWYTVAVNVSGSELVVDGDTKITAPQSTAGMALYLGNATTSTFHGKTDVIAGTLGIHSLGSGTFDKQVTMNLQDDTTTSAAKGVFSEGSSLLNFHGLLNITMGTSTTPGYGIASNGSNSIVNINAGAFIDLENVSGNAVGIYANNGHVNVQGDLSIYSGYGDTNSGSWALYSSNNSTINISNSKVTLDGIITAAKSSTISLSTNTGSSIIGPSLIKDNASVNFDLNNTSWIFTEDSALTTLSGSNSKINCCNLPHNGVDFKTLTIGSLSGDNHTFYLNTVLDDGSSQLSDKVIIEQSGTGQHKLHINNVSGTGALTIGEGIQVVEVNGTSTRDNFSLANVVREGLYEYVLRQGSGSDQSWYLTSSTYIPTPEPDQDVDFDVDFESTPPDPGPTPAPNPGPIPLPNPDIGAYLANQTAATGLFLHSLHDRVGEPQFAERYKNNGVRQSSVWVRTQASNSKNNAGNGVFRQDNQGYLLHLGGEIMRWSNDNNHRYSLGVMGAYGRSETTTISQLTGSKVNSYVEGYGAGLYFTWYQNSQSAEGWYADAWSMYKWLDNKTESIEKYKSRVWSNSAELGYALTIAESERHQWMFEPQGQVVYSYYDVDSHTDNYKLRVSNGERHHLNTRLGGRFYLGDKQNAWNAQPFVEVNWLYGSAKNSLKFDGVALSDDTPKHRFEVKVGVQGMITDNLHIYSHIGLQKGKNNYQGAEGQLGLKYRF